MISAFNHGTADRVGPYLIAARFNLDGLPDHAGPRRVAVANGTIRYSFGAEAICPCQWRL